MNPITFKVDPKVAQELDLIKNEEGLGNRTATFTFLIKYYLLTKKSTLNDSIDLMEKLAGKIDPNTLPSAEEQLSDL